MLVFDQQLCLPLHTAGHLLTRLYRPLLDKLGLTYPQHPVTLAYWQQALCAVGDFGRKLHLDTGTLTPLPKRLEEQGSVMRMRGPDDQRRAIIELTDTGRALCECAAKVPETFACKIPLELDETGATRDVLRKLLGALTTVDGRE